MKTIGQRYRHLRRYQEIAQVLIKHGFGDVVEKLGLAEYLELPQRILRRKAIKTATELTAPQRVRLAIQELGPTFIKLAQVLSTRPDLVPPAFLEELVLLQDSVSPSPWAAIKTRIEEELGVSLEAVFADIESEPVAVASLAQVHLATLHGGEQVVVKVQRPGIEKVIATDLEILFDLARFVQSHTALGQIYDLPEIAEDFAYTLHSELDYRLEGRNADRFRQNFTGEAYLHIPKVYWDFTVQRVIIFERLSGLKIDDIQALDAAGLDRHQVALLSARIIVKEVLEDGFFHGDPHPGNFFVMINEQGEPLIGAMDFGMVGRIQPHVREELIRLFIKAVDMDSEGIVEQLVHLSGNQYRVDQVQLQRDVDRVLARYQDLPLKEIRAHEVLQEILPIAYRYKLRIPSDLWLLGRALAMMEGVGLKLDPEFDLFSVARPHAKRFMRQMISPQVWGKKLRKGAGEWGELFFDLPARVPRMLDQISQGELDIGLRLRGQDSILRRLDMLINRLVVSIVVAALIIGLSSVAVAQSAGSWLALSGFVIAMLLGIWLIISIWRSGRY